LENQRESVSAMFRAIAPRYDLMNSLMSLGRVRSWRRSAIERSGLGAGGFGLDVCCGTGMLALEMARAVGPAGRVVGLDFSQAMLAVARKNLNGLACKEKIRLIQGDALALPFEDHTFDGATVGWGLRNVPDILAAVREMARVVKPGGKVVSIDMGQPGLLGFKQLYWLCLGRVIPVMGAIWTGNRGAYTYLYESARAFPHPRELARLFSEAGLVETQYHLLSGGVVAVVEGKSPNLPKGMI